MSVGASVDGRGQPSGPSVDGRGQPSGPSVDGRGQPSGPSVDGRGQPSGPSVDGQRLSLMTPEEVPLVFELAPVGSRALAFVTDFAIIAATVLLIVVIAWEALKGAYSELDLDRANIIGAVVDLSIFLVWNFYFIITELRWQGRTIGKRLAGIRVIARDGGPLSADLVFARNLTRDLEMLIPLMAIIQPRVIGLEDPVLLAVCWLWLGILALMPLMNRYRARIGDLVAGTLVVTAPAERLLPDLVEKEDPASDIGSGDPRYPFTSEQLETYGIRELQILEDVLRRYPDQIDPELLATIADKIQTKIAWQSPDGRSPEPYPFLRAFYSAQRARLEHKLLFGQRREQKVR